MKGIVFTVATFFIVFSLVSLATAFANANLDIKHDVSLLTSADKTGYAFESLHSQLIRGTGVDISKNSTNVTLNDTMPRTSSVASFLQKYDTFVNQKFEDATLSANFTSATGTAINWNVVDKLAIAPANLTYAYANLSKDSWELRARNTTRLGSLVRADLFVRVSGALTAGVWSPDNTCAPAGVTPNCIPFAATVTNGTATWNSGEKNFNLSRQSSIRHDVGAGFVRITVGITPPDSLVVQTNVSSVSVNTSLTLKFNTSDFTVVTDPTRLRVFDDVTYIESGA